MFDKERQAKLEDYLLNTTHKTEKTMLLSKQSKSKCLEVITYPNAKWVLENGTVKRVTFESKTLLDFASNCIVSYSDLNKVMDLGDPSIADHNVYLKLSLGSSSTAIPFNEIQEALTVYEYIKRILVGKGNNYVSIKDGEISGKTIPASKKIKNTI